LVLEVLVQSGIVISVVTSTSWTLTLPRKPSCRPPAVGLILPAPGDTLQRDAEPITVHGPPTSADPQPAETVRLKLSEAITVLVLTVKLLVLVAVPLGVVTEIGPLLAPAGTVAVICEFELTVNVVAVPPNETAVVPVRLLPLIVTLVPVGPLVGVKPLIEGAGPVASVVAW
jgi:hypothetical protein